MHCTSGSMLSVCHLLCFRGYKLQDAHIKDEGVIELRSVEKGISSPALCSVSPTCRARGNHFSILHPPDFLPNVLFSSLVCLCLSHSVSLSDSLFSQTFLIPSFSPPPYAFCFAVCSCSCVMYFFLFTCSTLRQILFHCCSHEGPIGDLLRTHTHNNHSSAAAVKLSLTFTHRNININQRRVAENEREKAVQLWLL